MNGCPLLNIGGTGGRICDRIRNGAEKNRTELNIWKNIEQNAGRKRGQSTGQNIIQNSMTGDLYKAVSCLRDDSHFEWLVELNPESAIFAAHFPGNPIMPGACQVEMMRELLCRGYSARVDITGIKTLKFLQVINPCLVRTLSVNMDCTVREGENQIKCSVTVSPVDVPSQTAQEAADSAGSDGAPNPSAVCTKAVLFFRCDASSSASGDCSQDCSCIDLTECSGGGLHK